MIEINLLPQEYKEKKVSLKEILGEKKDLFVKIIPGVVGILVFFLVSIFLYPSCQSRRLGNLKNQWDMIESDYSKAKELKKKQSLFKRKVDCLNYIMDTRLLWAPTLNSISDALPSEIQITEIVTSREEIEETNVEVLNISGLVPVSPGEKAIEEFIYNLKNDVDFISKFSQILPPSAKTVKGGIKVFSFKCYIKEQFTIKGSENET